MKQNFATLYNAKCQNAKMLCSAQKDILNLGVRSTLWHLNKFTESFYSCNSLGNEGCQKKTLKTKLQQNSILKLFLARGHAI